jgi:hypothetical protein
MEMRLLLRRLGLLLGASILTSFLTVIILPFPETFKVKILKEASISPTFGIDYAVEAPLDVQVGPDVYSVPQGFVTDLASIPRPLWGVIAPNEAHFVYPAILHDYLYSCPHGLERQDIDGIFYSFLRERGVSQFKAYQFFFAVRVFGGSHFTKHNYCHLELRIKHE